MLLTAEISEWSVLEPGACQISTVYGGGRHRKDAMSRKRQFIIDGARFSTLKAFYDEVERVLCPNIGFRWNRGLDGFNDILKGGFGSFEYEEPIELIWKNSEKSRNDLGYRETVRQLRKWLWQYHPGHIPRIWRELKEAKKGKGDTIFDMLIETIRENTHIDLTLA